MATQDDINNLTDQIAEEQQSAAILDKQISAEQQKSTRLIDAWQQQANRHRDAATRMDQDLRAKQQQLEREQLETLAANEKTKNAAEKIARGLL